MLEHNAVLRWQLSRVEGSVVAQLFFDSGIPDKAKPFKQLSGRTTLDATDDVNLEQGAYLVRVAAASNAAALYTVALTAEAYSPDQPQPEPGNRQDDALEVGKLSSLREYGGFVGASDPADFYRFGLASNGRVRLQLSQIRGAVTGQVFRDTSLLDTDHPEGSFTASMTADGTYAANLAEGKYLLRIVPSPSTEALYKLSLSAEVAE